MLFFCSIIAVSPLFVFVYFVPYYCFLVFYWFKLPCSCSCFCCCCCYWYFSCWYSCRRYSLLLPPLRRMCFVFVVVFCVHLKNPNHKNLLQQQHKKYTFFTVSILTSFANTQTDTRTELLLAHFFLFFASEKNYEMLIFYAFIHFISNLFRCIFLFHCNAKQRQHYDSSSLFIGCYTHFSQTTAFILEDS